jgi:hypothetical protein
MRLTKEYREEVLGRILRTAFQARFDAMQEAEHAIGMRMWQAMYGAHAEAMNRLPPGFLSTDKRVFMEQIPAPLRELIRALESRRHPVLRTKTDFYYVRLGAVLRVSQHNLLSCPDHRDLVQAYHAHLAALEALYDEADAFEVSARSLLFSVNTRDELLRVWPEVKPLLPEPTLKERRVPVPVDLTLTLNKQLGLMAAPA